MPAIHVNGIDLYHEVERDGPPLVVVHGSWADHTNWQAAAALRAVAGGELARLAGEVTATIGVVLAELEAGDIERGTRRFVEEVALGPGGWDCCPSLGSARTSASARAVGSRSRRRKRELPRRRIAHSTIVRGGHVWMRWGTLASGRQRSHAVLSAD